ncbi:NhaC family Na+:H+ antiporter [Acetoanaerobium pronyense]|uniref:NhaC family Na+:H+ antiporter n=1 Tax=Acetoanaerobium pronyense TaxID=1482736 RepID=A0ABS4KKS1_9FIRM|nr:Na+/H+ antiporter NhaC [Acetoanaerobium pronyense]MBP2028398.1 NhaC family Na+:H+ antiporter [Acetoanaerobium pronyense]
MSKVKTKREASLFEALIPILVLIGVLIPSILVFGQDPHIPIVIAAVVAAALAITRLGYTWNEIEEGILKTINMGMQAIIILMIIGMIIGTWILGGVVPTMIYYGLQILSPAIFLVATAVICSVVSLATGSSWTTAGTVGIALLGVGQGLGIPVAIVAGAIISGAYFGDKMSPLSDTTNLAPAMAGSNLFDHIRHMALTTGPSLLIALVLYGFIGMRYAGQSVNDSQIADILTALSSGFNINLLLLLPPVLVIAMVIFKVPAIPGLIGGVFLGSIFAVIFQGADFGAVIDAANYGFVSETGLELVDDLLSRGGMQDMMWTVSLIIAALSFGGILESTGMLGVVAGNILKLAVNTGSLVLATVVSCFVVNIITGEQYLSVVIPGRMFKDAYADRGLAPVNLSRALEDSGTITSPLIPWNTCGAFMYGTLGVHPFAYAPYAFLNLINPFVSIFYGFTGISMIKMTDAEIAAYEASKHHSVAK